MQMIVQPLSFLTSKFWSHPLTNYLGTLSDENFIAWQNNVKNVWQIFVIVWQNCANVRQKFVNFHIFSLSGKIVSVVKTGRN